MEAGLQVGPVTVITTENRGHTPEEVALRCVNRLMSVSDTAPPVIRDQARAFKEHMLLIVAQYMREAIKSDRTTLYNELSKQGHRSMAELIRRI